LLAPSILSIFSDRFFPISILIGDKSCRASSDTAVDIEVEAGLVVEDEAGWLGVDPKEKGKTSKEEEPLLDQGLRSTDMSSR